MQVQNANSTWNSEGIRTSHDEMRYVLCTSKRMLHFEVKEKDKMRYHAALTQSSRLRIYAMPSIAAQIISMIMYNHQH